MKVSDEHLKLICNELHRLVDDDEPFQEHLIDFSMEVNPVNVELVRIEDTDFEGRLIYSHRIDKAIMTDEYGEEYDITLILDDQWQK